MSLPFDLAVEISQPYEFSKAGLDQFDNNPWVKGLWPIVYFIHDDRTKLAYIGESTHAANRIRTHLNNPKRKSLAKILIIGSDKFNKSATMDLESKLIQYIHAEGTYIPLNGNQGLIHHQYYQQDLYNNLFREVWNKFRERGIISKSLKKTENSEIFKFSPYKSLNEDQYNSILKILNKITTHQSSKIFIRGSAGTGKTVLACYLAKLLVSDTTEPEDDVNEEELKEISFIKKFQKLYPHKRIALVVAMNSLRKSLQRVFSKTPGLRSSMVISPSDVANSKYTFDLLIIDEAHRLRQFKNIGWMGAFRKTNKSLGLDDNGNELDWILMKSKNQIFFYDPSQSVKPSDINERNFIKIIKHPETQVLELRSQMRVKAGDDYIRFVDELLNVKRSDKRLFQPENYEISVFNRLEELLEELKEREERFELCRLVAGYAWPWHSKNDNSAYDIEIDGLKLRWNSTSEDWVNSKNAFHEVGCIHTVQGYDLNYAGIVFGREIKFNPETRQIEIDRKNYHDRFGREGISDLELKDYIINIYKTIMYRGIKGTFIYACDDNLRLYFQEHIASFSTQIPFRIVPTEKVKPYINSIPLVDITAAAGDFSGFQNVFKLTWIEPPFNISARKNYFVCRVVGESMNEIIPNGSWCLFKEYEGGSREGKIVLAQSIEIQDADFGAGFTVKEYHSTKKITSEGWEHTSIILRPRSRQSHYKDLLLTPDNQTQVKIIGIFDRIIG